MDYFVWIYICCSRTALQTRSNTVNSYIHTNLRTISSLTIKFVRPCSTVVLEHFGYMSVSTPNLSSAFVAAKLHNTKD